MFVCSNSPGIVVDEECVGKIIEIFGETTNICVHTDEDGREYISFDATATFTDGTKANVHVNKAYPYINELDISVGTVLHQTTFKLSLILNSIECGCKDQPAYFTVTPIKEMTKAEIEKELGYKIEIVEK